MGMMSIQADVLFRQTDTHQ